MRSRYAAEAAGTAEIVVPVPGTGMETIVEADP
jgi:hypothetical protein